MATGTWEEFFEPRILQKRFQCPTKIKSPKRIQGKKAKITSLAPHVTLKEAALCRGKDDEVICIPILWDPDTGAYSVLLNIEQTCTDEPSEDSKRQQCTEQTRSLQHSPIAPANQLSHSTEHIATLFLKIPSVSSVTKFIMKTLNWNTPWVEES